MPPPVLAAELPSAAGLSGAAAGPPAAAGGRDDGAGRRDRGGAATGRPAAGRCHARLRPRPAGRAARPPRRRWQILDRLALSPDRRVRARAAPRAVELRLAAGEITPAARRRCDGQAAVRLARRRARGGDAPARRRAARPGRRRRAQALAHAARNRRGAAGRAGRAARPHGVDFRRRPRRRCRRRRCRRWNWWRWPRKTPT